MGINCNNDFGKLWHSLLKLKILIFCDSAILLRDIYPALKNAHTDEKDVYEHTQHYLKSPKTRKNPHVHGHRMGEWYIRGRTAVGVIFTESNQWSHDGHCMQQRGWMGSSSNQVTKRNFAWAGERWPLRAEKPAHGGALSPWGPHPHLGAAASATASLSCSEDHVPFHICPTLWIPSRFWVFNSLSGWEPASLPVFLSTAVICLQLSLLAKVWAPSGQKAHLSGPSCMARASEGSALGKGSMTTAICLMHRPTLPQGNAALSKDLTLSRVPISSPVKERSVPGSQDSLVSGTGPGTYYPEC